MMESVRKGYLLSLKVQILAETGTHAVVGGRFDM